MNGGRVAVRSDVAKDQRNTNWPRRTVATWLRSQAVAKVPPRPSHPR